MRVFVAVEISEAVRETVAARIDFLRAHFPDLRAGWEKTEKLHLTVKFLGEIDESRVQDLTIATEKAARLISPFELTIENAGAFPARGAPRVLWLGVKDASGNFLKFNRELENNCAAVNFETENRLFKPHLTIARLKEPHNSREITAMHLEMPFAAQNFLVGEIAIIQSRLLPHGSTYQTLTRIKLAE